jgi:hypothetical protein
VLASQETIDTLADRIERAYRLRHPGWNRGCSTSRVWAAAATVLHAVRRDDPTIPLDPELFVAAQCGVLEFADPWLELADPTAGRRYRDRVWQIVDGLRCELGREVRRAEREIRRGIPIDRVVLAKGRSLSALGCYILARRAGRDDLAERLRRGAADQHRSCPLYRQACLSLLPPDAYPVRGSLSGIDTATPIHRTRIQLDLN